MPVPQTRRLRLLPLALLLAGAILLEFGAWPRTVENERSFDPATGVVSHAQTAEIARVTGLAMCAAGIVARALTRRL